MSRNRNTETEVLETPAEEFLVALISAKELAAELDIDAKSFRRWLRTLTDNRAGKGGRWVFDPATAELVRTAWAARAAKGTTPSLAASED